MYGVSSTFFTIALLAMGSVDAHPSLGRRHGHGLEKRQEGGGDCTTLPDDPNIVAVTPDGMQKGFAMGTNKACSDGMYCPYACKPGMQMAQWKEGTSYANGDTVNGGVLCSGGQTSKPFPDQPYCVDGHGTVSAKNSAGGNVAFCQTVLPGFENMIIPTDVGSGETVLNVPGSEYWDGATAAHYYINAPGVSTEEGCVWGSKEKPIGNWAPYVAGANVGFESQTSVKIGWNPVYLEEATPFRYEKPEFGLKIECSSGSTCNGLPCYIDPAVHAVNEMNVAGGTQTGAGGGAFCVVAVTSGSAVINVISPGQGGGDGTASGNSSAVSSGTGGSSTSAGTSAAAATSAASSSAPGAADAASTTTTSLAAAATTSTSQRGQLGSK